jgi:GNAT superfamily N-acetyltransferase
MRSKQSGELRVNSIRIVKVVTKRDLNRFIRFPWRVYAGNPYWVPPLLMDMKDRLDRRKHPFFEHAEGDYFLALRGGDTVGRIAAVIDRNHNAAHNETTAFFGLYESLNDREAAPALVNAAAGWAQERGMTRLRGPMNFSMNDECAFLLEGFEAPPVVMMPYNPPYYLELMDACGLAKAKDLYAFRKDKSRILSEKAEEFLNRLRAANTFTFRSPKKATLQDEGRKIAEVYNSGWRHNWGFVPWTEREMAHMVRNLGWLADLDLVIFAEHDGRTAGFAFALPDYNQVLIRMNGRIFPFGLFKFLAGRRRIKGVRALVFGVIPEFMHTGLAYLLYDEFEKAIIRKGYEWCELSWQLEDNEAINRFAASIGAALYKRYRIYEKDIGSGGG